MNRSIDYEFHLIEKFPANVYVDKYELSEPKYVRNFNFSLSTNLDIEKPENDSQPFEMHVYPQAPECQAIDSLSRKCEIKVKLPFHIRYHSGSPRESYAYFRLFEPKLYAKCLHNCYESSFKTLKTESFPCTQSNDGFKCEWNEQNYKKVKTFNISMVS